MSASDLQDQLAALESSRRRTSDRLIQLEEDEKHDVSENVHVAVDELLRDVGTKRYAATAVYLSELHSIPLTTLKRKTMNVHRLKEQGAPSSSELELAYTATIGGHHQKISEEVVASVLREMTARAVGREAVTVQPYYERSVFTGADAAGILGDSAVKGSFQELVISEYNKETSRLYPSGDVPRSRMSAPSASTIKRLEKLMPKQKAVEYSNTRRTTAAGDIANFISTVCVFRALHDVHIAESGHRVARDRVPSELMFNLDGSSILIGKEGRVTAFVDDETSKNARMKQQGIKTNAPKATGGKKRGINYHELTVEAGKDLATVMVIKDKNSKAIFSRRTSSTTTEGSTSCCTDSRSLR
jgi:hypothetical protein